MLALVLASLISGAQGTENACPASVKPWNNYGGYGPLSLHGQGCANFDSGTSQPNCRYVVQKSIPSTGGCGTGLFTLSDDLALGFAPACNFHDACYGRCTDPCGEDGAFLQVHCDVIFYKLMHDYCAGLSAGSEACALAALAMYTAVRADSDAFKATVESRCACSNTPNSIAAQPWYENLVSDMGSDQDKYEDWRAAICPLLQDSAAFNTYLAEAMRMNNEDPNLDTVIQTACGIGGGSASGTSGSSGASTGSTGSIVRACNIGGGSASGVTRALPSMLAMLFIIAIGHGR